MSTPKRQCSRRCQIWLFNSAEFVGFWYGYCAGGCDIVGVRKKVLPMEKREQIAEEALDRLVFQTWLELQRQDAAADQAEAALSRISDAIRTDKALSEDEQMVMLNYVREVTGLTARQYRHLYLQGARDCVAALRKLGVIR